MHLNKLLFAGLLFLFMISPVFAQEFKNSQLQISRLQDHVWVVETSDMGTMYLIEGTNKALLIDTGTKCDSLDEIIRKITKKPLSVVLTHAHHDHAGNIGHFPEIYMHAADTVLLKNNYKGKLNFINDGYIFDLGGKKIEVSWMPAHTPGTIVLLDRPAHSCYTGDAFGSGQVWLQLKPVAPMREYIGSCSKMIKLMDNGIDSLYCGHYSYLKSALDKQHMITMLHLAESIENGTVKNAEPFTRKVSIGCENPMIATEGKVAIVYDPEHLK
jgi:glyoxylase-like metal-dependent hydrolase (beta-lactamase superfamily II)